MDGDELLRLIIEDDRNKSPILENSKILDIHRWCSHKGVDTLVDTIFDAHFKERKKSITKKHIKVVILDLYSTWIEDFGRVIAFSRNVNDYKAGTRYNEIGISRKTIEVVDVLVKAGLVIQLKGFLDRTNGRGRLSRIWPTKSLTDMFEAADISVFDIAYRDDRSTVILRDNDSEDDVFSEIPFEQTAETELMEKHIKDYNFVLRRHYIDIPDLEECYILSEYRRVYINQTDKFVRRIFNRGSFSFGGRFFGGWWQRIPKEERQRIFIDDFPTNEIDYSGLHVVMLYAEKGINYWKEIGCDPYTIQVPSFLRNAQEARKTAKLLLLMLLNAKDAPTAYNGFRNQSKNFLTNLQLDEIHRSLKKKHPIIAESFGSDAGIRLMNCDAIITDHIISHFTKIGVPVLTIHDSYIVPVGYEDDLTNTMCHAFEKVMGLSILPCADVAMKEISERVEDIESELMLSMNPYSKYDIVRHYNYVNRVMPKKTKRYSEIQGLFNKWISRVN